MLFILLLYHYLLLHPSLPVFSPYCIFDNVTNLRFLTEGTRPHFLPFSEENINYIGRMLMIYYYL